MPNLGWRPSPGELRQRLRDHAGLDFPVLVLADGGESGTTFLATDHSGAVSVVKILTDAEGGGGGPAGLTRLRTLVTAVRHLRDRGCPVPPVTAAGQAPGLVFWITERISGTPLESSDGHPDLEAIARFLPEIIKLNNAQAGLGAGDPQEWPDLIRRTLTSGGDGYCVHATLDANPGTRDLLALVRRTGERFGSSVPTGNDFCHYDFHPGNLMSDGVSLTGVIDVNPPVLGGDRAFDLATLLFYCQDHAAIRDALRRRLLELAEPGVARAYLAHIALRQTDWSLRFYPNAAGTHRHLRLAEMAADDIRQIGGRIRPVV